MIDPDLLKQVGWVIAMVTQMAFTVIAGVVVGHWLDQRFGTSPIFLLVLSLAALVVGMIRLARSIARLNDDDPAPPDGLHRDDQDHSTNHRA